LSGGSTISGGARARYQEIKLSGRTVFAVTDANAASPHG
jgi:hypothetical protein